MFLVLKTCSTPPQFFSCSVLPSYRQTNHPTIQSSNHPTIQPFNHPTIQPTATNHPGIEYKYGTNGLLIRRSNDKLQLRHVAHLVYESRD